MPTNPINSAIKGPTMAAAVILSQVELVITLSIPSSPILLSVKDYGLVETSLGETVLV